MTSNLISEGEHFDYLSILGVKASNDHNNFEKNKENYINCLNYLYLQLNKKTYEILGSQEYIDLYKINKEIFDLIDRLRKNGETVGDKIDAENLKRFEAKKQLQKKFFGNEINETKKVYNK